MKNLSGEQLVALATYTAVKIARANENDEILVLADFFNLIGATLITLYDRQSIDPQSAKDNNNKNLFPD